MRTVWAIPLIAVFACSCGPKLMEVGSISEIRPNSGGGPGLDVYATRRRAGEKVPELAGDQILDVRTFVSAEGPFGNEIAGEEFAGARCTVKARDYSAQVTTPARLRVPIYRLESSALSVACERDAFEPRSLVLEVYNKTKADRYAAASGNGVAGLVVMAAINEMSDETKHEFAYPSARVIMTPRQTTAAVPKKG
jgi:hypothetical protein